MTTANPLIAPRVDTTTLWSGIFIAEDIEGLIQGFRSGSWIDITIGGFATALDALATIVDPLGQIAAWGAAWLMEHVSPLSEGLDALAGDPDQITAFARTWGNAAAAVERAGFDLQAAVDREILDWTGAAANAYRNHAAEQLGAMAALKAAYSAMGEMVEGMGLVVALARGLVRDLLAEFVATLAVRLPTWLAAEGVTLGLATPVVVAQAGAMVARWFGRIAKLLRGVVKTMRALMPILKRLDALIAALRAVARRLARANPGGSGMHPPHDPHTPHTGGVHPPGGPPHRSPDEVDDIIDGIIEESTPQPGQFEQGSRPRGFAGEQDMGFYYSQEKGWAFLEGPSGGGGHQANAHGFDGVAFTTEGPLEIHILDNKSLADRANVGDASALTTNLEQNLDRLHQRANDPSMNDVPRINEIRDSIGRARDAVATGAPMPPDVHLVVTNSGSERVTGVTQGLANQGVEFRDTHTPPTVAPSP